MGDRLEPLLCMPQTLGGSARTEPCAFMPTKYKSTYKSSAFRVSALFRVAVSGFEAFRC